MKLLLTIFCFIFSYAVAAIGQTLSIDSTVFIRCNRPAIQIEYAIQTSDNGVFFVGLDAGNPGGVVPVLSIDTVLENVIVGKIDSNRQLSWIKVYGGSDDDIAVSACQTPNGDYGIIAETFSNDGNVNENKGGNDLWILKVDRNGDIIWAKTYGSAASDEPISIASTPDNGFIVLGVTYGSDGDVPFHYGDIMISDWLVVKTDSMGNVQWSKDFGGTDGEAQAGSILSIDSNYYLISSSISTDKDCTDSTWHPGINTREDIYVLKLDAAGTVLWDSSYGGTGEENIHNAIFDTRDSTIVMAGGTNSADYMITGYHGCDYGDMWILKINKNGALIWQKTLGSIQGDIAADICIAPDNGYIVYGTTYPHFCNDTSIGDIGNQDCWVFSLDNSGNSHANKIFGGTDVEFARSIVPLKDGYAITGISASGAFSTGSTDGRNYEGQCGFISYIDYWPLAAENITTPALQILAYPNPAQEEINISLPSGSLGRLYIANTLGQVIYSDKTKRQATDKQVQVSTWPSGVYEIIWQGADGTVLVNKFIKS